MPVRYYKLGLTIFCCDKDCRIALAKHSGLKFLYWIVSWLYGKLSNNPYYSRMNSKSVIRYRYFSDTRVLWHAMRKSYVRVYSGLVGKKPLYGPFDNA